MPAKAEAEAPSELNGVGVKKGASIERSGNAEAPAEVAEAWVNPYAAGGAKDHRMVVPGAAADNARTAARALIAILHPLRHIAVHVMETESIRRVERAHIDGLLPIHSSEASCEALAVGMVEVRLIGRYRLSG
jgi:hypothetical protein